MILKTIKKIWSWIKRKIKEILIITGVIGIASAATFLPNGDVPSLSVDGKMVKLAYTDDNSGEELIIRTDQERYFNPFGSISVVYSITNNSDKDQWVKTVFSFNDQNGNKKYVKEIEEYDGTTIEEVVIPAHYVSSTKEFVATTTIQKEKTLWKKHALSDFNASEVTVKRKDIKKTKGFKKNTFFLKSGETRFFRASINYTDFNDKEEFFIEAFGSKGAYGHLE